MYQVRYNTPRYHYRGVQVEQIISKHMTYSDDIDKANQELYIADMKKVHLDRPCMGPSVRLMGRLDTNSPSILPE